MKQELKNIHSWWTWCWLINIVHEIKKKYILIQIHYETNNVWSYQKTSRCLAAFGIKYCTWHSLILSGDIVGIKWSEPSSVPPMKRTNCVHDKTSESTKMKTCLEALGTKIQLVLFHLFSCSYFLKSHVFFSQFHIKK